MGENAKAKDKRRLAAFKAAEPLLAALHRLAATDPPEARALALGPLASLAHPSSLAVLVAATRDPATLRAARHALVQYGTPGAVKALRDLLESVEDQSFRHDTLVLLGGMDLELATDLLTFFTSSPEAKLREGAARGLGFRTGAAVEDALLRLLEDPEKDVAVAALLSLRKVGTDRSTGALLRALAQSKNVFVRSTAILTLGRLAPQEARAAVRRFAKDPDDRIRASAIEALARSIATHPEDVALLKEGLKDPANRVRGNAILGLHQIDPTPCQRAFLELMRSPRKNWRATAAWVLGQVQDPELFAAYLPAFNTEVDRDVQALALKSVEQATDRRLIDTLGRLLQHPNVEMRLRAALAWRPMARPADRGRMLSALLKETDPRAKVAMLSILGGLSTASSFSDLLPFLDDADPRVQAAAVEALGKVGDLAVSNVLRDHMEARHPVIRAYAIGAILRLGDLEVLPKLAEMVLEREAETVRAGCQAATLFCEELQAVVRGAARSPALEAAIDALAATLGDQEPTPIPVVEEKVADQSAAWEVAYARALLDADDTRALEVLAKQKNGTMLATYLTRMKGQDPVSDAERKLFRNEHFMPGLFLALEREKTAGTKRQVQARYLELGEAHLALLQEFLARAHERTREGKEALVYRMLDFFFRQLKLAPDLHRIFGTQYLQMKEYDLAFDHLLKAYAVQPDLELILQAAGAAIRIHKTAVARALLEGLDRQLPADSELRPRVAGLLRIVSGEVPPPPEPAAAPRAPPEPME